jgi:acyl-CoA thioesterase FadM
MSIDFRSPVTPRHRLICEVRLIRLGESSVRFAVVGRQDGAVCFEGEFVEVFVEADIHKKIRVPDDMRPKLEALVQE